jgi:type I restriction enzyme M protein
VRAQVIDDHGRGGRQSLEGGHDDLASGLLGDDLEQAAQLRPAHPLDAEDRGSAAIVLPDKVLFEGGAGETIRRRLLEECDVERLAAPFDQPVGEVEIAIIKGEIDLSNATEVGL